MNLLERKMLDSLKELREDYNVFGIKAELEAEGSRIEELMRLQEMVIRAGLGITLKIGGAEAIYDMRVGQNLGVAEIIAPMIESPFAVKKFLTAAKIVFDEEELKDVSLAINVETVTGYKQFSEMLEVPGFSMIGGLSIGRVDMVHSLGMTRDDLNSDKMFSVCNDMFVLMKEKYPKAHTILGGIGNLEALSFFDRFAPGIADAYEMRKVIFHGGQSGKKRVEGYMKAIEFELDWLKNKVERHIAITKEDVAYANRLKANLEAIANTL